jgi:uncharacterized protein YcfJ
MKTLIPLTVVALLVSGCATMGDWEPVVDRQVDAHPENVDRDLEQCRQLARQSSDVEGSEAEGGVVGAASGLVLGGLLGGPRTAVAGAVVGGGVGAASQGSGSAEHYKRTYVRCMRGRGHRVIG